MIKPDSAHSLSKRTHGFTLIEAIAVIVVTGILASVVAVFISGPVGGYVDAARRVMISDMADNALRRMGRDIRLAVPNSVRVSGTALEFIPTNDGVRYRAEQTVLSGVASGSVLDFSAVKTAGSTQFFDVFGVGSATAASGDFMVVFNTGQAGAANCVGGGADAYQGCNRRTLVAVAATNTGISYTNTNLALPFDSPGHRVNFVPSTGPATYSCEGAGLLNGSGSGSLRRYTGYGWNATQIIPAVGGGALLAENISQCSFTYSQGTTWRSGLVTLSLTITRSNESVTLYHEIHVDNQP